MIIRYCLFLAILNIVHSDEHIAIQSETVVSNTQDDAVKILSQKLPPDSVIKEQIMDSQTPSALPNPASAEELPNAGINQFRDSSYITFTTLVKARTIECFFYKARKSFDIDFQVLRGGDFDIAILIHDQTSKQVAFHKPASDGTIKVAVPIEMVNTDYSICLDNQQLSWHTKKVFVMVDVEGPNGINHPDLQNSEYAQLTKHMTKLDLMNTALSNVYASLIQVEHHQERRRLVESIDRSIMERNYEYVTLWAIVQISLMVIVAATQVVMIRSLFDLRGGVGAKIWMKLSKLSGGRL